MNVNEYDIGDGVVLQADFSRDDEPEDPTTVVCRVRKPRTDEPDEVNALLVGIVTNDEGEEVMRYEAEVVADTAGDWYYRFEGTGTVTAAGEQRFYVKRSNVLVD